MAAMRIKRTLLAAAVYAGGLLAGLLVALTIPFTITLLFAFAYDPHGTGPVGEGLLFLAVFFLSLVVGLPIGFICAGQVWYNYGPNKSPTSSTGSASDS